MKTRQFKQTVTTCLLACLSGIWFSNLQATPRERETSTPAVFIQPADTGTDEAARRARMKAELDAELKAEKQVAEQEEVLNKVEVMPEFPGGMSALINFLSTNLRYPKAAQALGKQGTVRVKFIVRKDGSISNVNVSKSVDKYLDEEAVRVIKAMPRWKPGTQGGKPVNVIYHLPISFKF